MRKTFLFSSLALALAAAGFAGQASAGDFSYRAERAPPTGTVFHYVKSNRDGSKPWQLEIYVASPTRIEVVKWVEGASDFVEVAADLDLARAMPVTMQQWNTAGGRREPKLWGQADAGSMQVKLKDGPQFKLEGGRELPLQLWGFDLSALAFMAPHLADPSKAFSLEVIDPNRPGSEGRPFAQGEARFEPVGEESIDGVACRKFRISGAVFGDAEGFLWLAKDTGRIERVEHAVPTSTDWTDWKLDLAGVEQIDGLQWESFKLKLADAQGGGGGASLAAAMKAAFDKGGMEALLAGIEGWRGENLKALEADLNTVGYTLLGMGKAAEALPLFERIAKDFPMSGNAWDSLGEAQLAAGQRPQALASYRKALQLDPRNDHAREVIAKLESAR